MVLGINAVRLTRNFTGVGRYLECLLRHWADNGTAFRRVILYVPKSIREDLVTFPIDAFEVRELPFSGPDPLWERRRLNAAADETDVLFGPSYTLPFGYRGPCAVAYLGPAHNPRFNYQAVRAAAYDRLARYSARRADHVFTCSEVVRRRVVDVYGVPEPKVSVTYLAASDLFRPIEASAERDRIVKQETGSNEPFLLFVGKLSGRHYIPELLQGYASLVRENRIRHRLVLAGPDVIGLDVPGRSRELGVGDRVHWTPFVRHHDLPALYSAADAFLFPTCEAEGFGIPVLEAMACGTPVVSVDQGSVSEFARGSALLVDQPTPEQLREAMVRITSDAELASGLRRAGKDTAQRITWAKTADKTMETLRRVAEAGKAHRGSNDALADGQPRA